MSTKADGNHGLSSASDSSRKYYENGTYTSLLESNGKSSFCRTAFSRLSCTVRLLMIIPPPGSFGSTFWYHANTDRARSDSNDETWSTTANTSTADEGEASQG